MLLEEGPLLEPGHLRLGASAADPAAALARDLGRVLEAGLPEAGVDLEQLVGALERHLVGEALAQAGGQPDAGGRRYYA